MQAGEHINVFKLTPGPHGKFDVTINGELVDEHTHEPNNHRFPDIQDLMRHINERI